MRRNIQTIKKLADGPLLLVVKNNAYGHGLRQVSGVAWESGVRDFGVATLDEARELRRHLGPVRARSARILVLNPSDPPHKAPPRGVALTVASKEFAQAVDNAAKGPRIFPRRKVPVHVLVDTGMGAGISHEHAAETIASLGDKPGSRLVVVGAYSHFVAPTGGSGELRKQLRRFEGVAEKLKESNVRVPLHMASSETMTTPDLWPAGRFDVVRSAGMALGLVAHPGIEPVLSLHARVEQVKSHKSDEHVGGYFYRSKSATHIASVHLGTADGIHRSIAGKASVLIGGKRYPIVDIRQNEMFIDVGNDAVHRGDRVTIFGKQGDEMIGVDEHVENGAWAYSRDLVTALHPRVPRIVTPH